MLSPASSFSAIRQLREEFGAPATIRGILSTPALVEPWEGRAMVQVTVSEGDDLDRVLRRFKRQVVKAGIFTDLKRKKHYEKQSETRKRKQSAARRRNRRR